MALLGAVMVENAMGGGQEGDGGGRVPTHPPTASCDSATCAGRGSTRQVGGQVDPQVIERKIKEHLSSLLSCPRPPRPRLVRRPSTVVLVQCPWLMGQVASQPLSPASMLGQWVIIIKSMHLKHSTYLIQPSVR